MASHETRPNVVFILTDDQRFDAFGAAGMPVETPSMDALAARGAWFTHAHVAGGTVGAICMPSRAMIHTGRSLFHLVDSGRSIPAGHTLLGEALREAGYRTFGAGKWHNGREAFARSFTDGDEIFFGGMADHWNVPAYHYDSSGEYDAQLPEIRDPFVTNEITYRNADHITPGRHSSELVADAASNFLSSPSSDEPYFVYAAFLAPHDPRTMPEELRSRYRPEDVELPPSFCGGHPFDNGDLHIRDEELAAFPRDPEEVKRHIAEYRAMIAHLDACIGRIVEAVRERGDLDNTIFILAGDNGLAVGRHGLMGKQNMYDHSTRVPLVFAGPGISEGRRCTDLVYLHDIFPTLCDLLNLRKPQSLEGSESLAPLLAGGATAPRDHLYLAYSSYQRAVRTAGHKLIEYAVGGHHRVQLFNLQADPWELNDLSQDESQRQLREELAAHLRAAARESGDLELEWGKEFWHTAGP
jgi:arylsulfatase A-like enzyme